MRRKLLNVKRIGILALVLALFIAVGVAEEERTDASGLWKYVLEDGGATITGCVEEPSGELVIPSELGGYPVTAIGDEAFDCASGFTGVTIPGSVTRIGERAFSLCAGLTSVTIPGSIKTIGDLAFVGCFRLESVTISEGVTSIGAGAFHECFSLPSLTIPASVTSIGANGKGLSYEYLVSDDYVMAFYDVASNNPQYEQIDGVLFDKQEKTLVMYPAGRQGAYAVPEGVLRIGDGAFFDCWGLTGVTIPDGVTSIGDWAFTGVVIGCENMTSATIPDSVTSIGQNAFYGCHNVTLSVAEGSCAEEYAKENEIPYVFTTEKTGHIG